MGKLVFFFAVFKLVIFSNFQFGNFSVFFGILGFSFLHVDFAILPDDFFFELAADPPGQIFEGRFLTLRVLLGLSLTRRCPGFSWQTIPPFDRSARLSPPPANPLTRL